MIFATCRLSIILAFRFLGNLVFCFSKKRKPVASHNISLCFSIKNKNEKLRNKKILKDSFVSLGHSFADFLLLRFYKQKNINKFIKTENIEYFNQALSLGKGVILSTAHFGSWELAAHFLALKGFKSLILYNPIKRPGWLERFVKKNRELNGNVLIAKQNALLPVFKQLKKGKFVTFITDQNCHPKDGLKVPFFGHKVWTHTAFIKLSLKTGAPVVPGFIFTEGLFNYRVEAFKPLYPQDYINCDNPEYEMALASNLALEKAIKKAPGHWMWQHRRFKNL